MTYLELWKFVQLEIYKTNSAAAWPPDWKEKHKEQAKVQCDKNHWSFDGYEFWFDSFPSHSNVCTCIHCNVVFESTDKPIVFY